MEHLAPVWTASAVAVAALMLSLWVASLALRDASIVDIFWGPGFVLVAWTGFAVGDGAPARQWWMALLTSAWGLRLGAYLLWRNRGQGEDRRYRAMRRRWGDRFAWVSLGTVFGLQGALLWLVSLPVQQAMAWPEPASLGPLAWAGGAVVAFGLAFESVGDWQLARFKADPANEGAVMDRGLWAWTRHPNYFGDAVVWWGLFLVALPTPGGWATAVGPVAMTFLLRRVSGVALLERDLQRRKPAYADYVRRVPAFVPRPPRRADG